MPRDIAPPLTKAGRAVQIKAADVLEDGTFTGYGSVFNVEDRGNDIVLPGAFAASLAEHARAGTLPALLWQHDPGEPIGVWLEMKEDSRGLWCKGKLFTEFDRGRQAHVCMKAGALSGLSIGYDCTEWEIEAEDGQGGGPVGMYGPYACGAQVRRLKKIDLWEVSVVTFPMNTEARIETVKRQRAARGGDTTPDLTRELAGLARALEARDFQPLQLQRIKHMALTHRRKQIALGLKRLTKEMGAEGDAGALAEIATEAVAEIAAQAGDPDSEMPAEAGVEALVEVAVAAVDAIAAEAGSPESEVPAEAAVEALVEIAQTVVADIAAEGASADSEVPEEAAEEALAQIAESASDASGGEEEPAEEPSATSAARRLRSFAR